MSQNANGADSRLGALMELIAEAPDALVVVSSIIPFPFAAAAVDSFNATILSGLDFTKMQRLVGSIRR